MVVTEGTQLLVRASLRVTGLGRPVVLPMISYCGEPSQPYQCPSFLLVGLAAVGVVILLLCVLVLVNCNLRREQNRQSRLELLYGPEN